MTLWEKDIDGQVVRVETNPLTGTLWVSVDGRVDHERIATYWHLVRKFTAMGIKVTDSDKERLYLTIVPASSATQTQPRRSPAQIVRRHGRTERHNEH